MNGTDRRDRAVEHLLRQSLHSSPDEATALCLDAETIAAWMDGGLSGAALESAQMHAADCARCQALLATFAQLNTPMPAPAPEPRRWFAWLVPLTAAAAIGIWALLPRSPRPEVPPQSGTMARNDDTRVLAAPEARLERAEPPPPAATALAPAMPAPAARQSVPPPAQAMAAPRELSPPAAERQQEADRFAGGALQDRAKAAAGNAAAAAPPPPAVGGLAAPPPPAPAAPRAREELLSQAASLSLQWRVSGARVERSVDRGATWSVAYTAPSLLTAIASSPPAVVWVAGRGGLVLRSIDGRDFARLPFPETVDLVAVRGTDSTSATVTTADGRALATTDAGATWRAPLQDF